MLIKKRKKTRTDYKNEKNMKGQLQVLKKKKRLLCQQLYMKYPLGHYHSTSMIGCECQKDKLNERIWNVNRQIDKLTMIKEKYDDIYKKDRITKDGTNWGSALDEHLRN